MTLPLVSLRNAAALPLVVVLVIVLVLMFLLTADHTNQTFGQWFKKTFGRVLP